MKKVVSALIVLALLFLAAGILAMAGLWFDPSAKVLGKLMVFCSVGFFVTTCVASVLVITTLPTNGSSHGNTKKSSSDRDPL